MATKTRLDRPPPPAFTKRLEQGLAYHRAGRLDDAEKAYKAALALQAGHPEPLHYLGLVAHQRGDHAKAVDLIGRAVAARPDSAAMASNLAEALRSAGRPQEAEAAARRAVDLAPTHAEPWLNLSAALFQLRRFGEAEEAAGRAASLRPAFVPALLARADSRRELGRTSEAEAGYREVLALAPAHTAARSNLGLMLVQAGRLEEGFALCHEASVAAGADAAALLNLGRAQVEYGLLDQAMETLEAALELDPNSSRLSLTIGRAWFELGDLAEAKNWTERSLALDEASVEARIQLARLDAEVENFEEAVDRLDPVIAAEPDRLDAWLARARARLSLGDVDGAVSDHREAIRVRPSSAPAHAALGHTLSTAGDIDGAVVSQRRAIELDPRNAPARAGILTTLRHKASDEERDAAIALLDAPWLNGQQKAALEFGLAAYYDGQGDWTRAAERMASANARRKAFETGRHRTYDPAAYERFVDQTIATFTPELFERLKGFGSDSERPVFIVGMPRSGTTLTEQIIASHPDAFGAGERAFAGQGFGLLPRVMSRPEDSPLACLAQATEEALKAVADWHLGRLASLDGGATSRIVDKMPDNFNQLGWLAVLFPKARFIHCRRDLRDVALSCWITNFGSIRWANDLDHLAHRIQQYQRLMEHWAKVLPVPVLPVDYEAMVADQEAQSRRLIDWVGLAWDDRVLAFHKTERLVRTASVSQVRQPIYQRSVARWTHYEEALAPVIHLVDSLTS